MRAHTKINPIGSGWGVFLTCWVAVVFGTVLAEWELAVRPVEVVEVLPPASAKVVFVKTIEDPTSDWQEKIASMMAGRTSGDLFLTAGDLNTFLKRSLKPQTTGAQIFFYTRMTNGRLWLGMMVNNTWLKHSFCIQAYGGFEKGPTGYFFAPERIYIGTLPLPSWMAKPLTAAIFAKMFEAEDAQRLINSWRAIDDIRLRERRMELRWN